MAARRLLQRGGSVAPALARRGGALFTASASAPVSQTAITAPRSLQGSGQFRLMVIDVLAEVMAAGDDQRQVPLAPGAEDASDAGVGDHRIGLVEVPKHLIKGHVGGGLSNSGGRRAGPVLDHELIGAQLAEGVKQPPKRLMVGADGDEDQRIPPSYSARAKRSATAGHCTKKRLASG